MSNPAFLFALAGISMSYVGFATLFLALRRHDIEWQSQEVGQVNCIVLYGLLTLFSALLVVPIASLIGGSAAFRLMSAALLVLALYMHQVRVGTSWLRWGKIRTYISRREQVIEVAPFAFAAVVEQVILLVNVLVARQDLYELALIMMLATPAFVFVLVVKNLMSNARHSNARSVTATASSTRSTSPEPFDKSQLAPQRTT
jgi:hypothetical protein